VPNSNFTGIVVSGTGSTRESADLSLDGTNAAQAHSAGPRIVAADEAPSVAGTVGSPGTAASTADSSATGGAIHDTRVITGSLQDPAPASDDTVWSWEEVSFDIGITETVTITSARDLADETANKADSGSGDTAPDAIGMQLRSEAPDDVSAGEPHNADEGEDDHDHDLYPVAPDTAPVDIITGGATTGNVTVSTLAASATFALHSNAGARHKIYLDFTGHTTTGTGWNSITGQTSFFSPGYDPGLDGAAFNAAELQQLRNIWQRVAEDFAPFDIDVTTEAPPVGDLIKSGGVDDRWGVRVVFTADDLPAPGSGGVAFLNSFDDNVDTPVFVFNRGEIGATEAASHEIGHALGLNHDGNATSGYDSGHATGGTGGNQWWAPILGAAYSGTITQWSKGEYGGATNTQDDLAIITSTTNGFGYRLDDYGNTFASATSLTATANKISAYGIIEKNTDVDIFGFTTGAGAVSLSINTGSRAYVSDGAGNYNVQYTAALGANLDIWAGLYNSAGVLLAQSDPVDDLNASFNLTLGAGTYYIKIDGVGKGSAATTGYSDYGSLGQYQITGTLVASGIAVPATPGATLVSDTGLSATDRITSNGALALTGIEAGASVQYSLNSGQSWTSSFAATEGLNSVQMRQTDTVGNISAASGSFTFTLDRTAATAPAISLAADTGVSATDRITSNGNLNLVGVETGASVQYSIDGGQNWTSSFAAKYGANAVQARQVDTAGNVSVASGAFTFTLDQGTNADFDGSGKSDILWRNTDGTVSAWLLNGTSITSGGNIGQPGNDWKVMGSGDFDGDGKGDILWRHTNGTVSAWLLNGTSIASGGNIGQPGNDWKVIGSGDFNGDGKDDILWRNTDGNVAAWLLDGTSIALGGNIGAPGSAWHVAGTGDFNGDGKDDILWRHDDGTVAAWLLNGTSIASGGNIGQPGNDWKVAGTGDFNGDGKDDILWRRDDGTVAAWMLNGTAITSGGNIGQPGNDWKIADTGDFNGDAKDDILWRHDNGTVAAWMLNGTQILSGGNIGQPGNSWQIQNHHYDYI
jgi:FG-GAP-like repeat/Metallo-peptidase family M12B Reprolysin-like